MPSQKKLAHIAGIFYLIIIVCAGFSEVQVRGSLIVPNDATQTAQNISASESLFRIGFAADLIAFLSDVVVAALFYILFKSVNQTLSLTSAYFRLIGTAIYGFNLLNYFAPLFLLSNASYLSAFNTEQLNTLVLFFLNLHKYGYDLGLVFFGLHCLLIGYLLFKSTSFPKILGILMIGAGLGYVIGSFTIFLIPNAETAIEPIYAIPAIGELSLCLYLLIKGAKEKTTTVQT